MLGRRVVTAEQKKAIAEVPERLERVIAPLNIPDERPLRDMLPGVWPTWGEFKRLMENFDV